MQRRFIIATQTRTSRRFRARRMDRPVRPFVREIRHESRIGISGPASDQTAEIIQRDGSRPVFGPLTSSADSFVPRDEGNPSRISRAYYRASILPLALRAFPRCNSFPLALQLFLFPRFSICSPSFAKCRVDRRISAPPALHASAAPI